MRKLFSFFWQNVHSLLKPQNGIFNHISFLTASSALSF
jgi:hypothetical protein